ncbi:hypothetical protein CHU98_g4131 [Xylaria longipes]|nr:hypothetical protein CHU98_g4131 [Xylaria longipes]
MRTPRFALVPRLVQLFSDYGYTCLRVDVATNDRRLLRPESTGFMKSRPNYAVSVRCRGRLLILSYRVGYDAFGAWPPHQQEPSSAREQHQPAPVSYLRYRMMAVLAVHPAKHEQVAESASRYKRAVRANAAVPHLVEPVATIGYATHDGMAMRTRHAIVIWPFITHADVTATILIGRGVKSLNTVKRSGVALALRLRIRLLVRAVVLGSPSLASDDRENAEFYLIVTLAIQA